MNGNTFVGLKKLEDNSKKIAWQDFDEFVTFFDNNDPTIKVVAYKGLGQDIVEAFKNNQQWDNSEFQRCVGLKLAQALNGMLKKDALGTAELKNVGEKCTGQHVLRPGHANRLPASSKGSLGKDRYLDIILGKWKDLESSREGLIYIRAHRLACWLMHGNPIGEMQTGEKDMVVTHACVRRPGCVRLACLQWGSQQSHRR